MDNNLPHDPQAEQAVLGAMMMDHYAVATTVQHISPADMYRPAHQTIMQAILDVWAAGKGSDPIIVATALDEAGHLPHIGGADYLQVVMQKTPTSANVEHYARRVADTSMLRRLHAAGQRATQLALTGEGTAEERADQAAQAFGQVERPAMNQAEPVGKITPLVMDTIEAITRGEDKGGVVCSTGFVELDEILDGGLRAGQMVIIAARPGVGKSTLAVDIARHHTVREHGRAVIFSLEMSKSELTQRVLSAEAGVRLKDMRAGQLEEGGWDSLARAVGELDDAKLFLDDSADLTLMEIRAKARRLKQQHGLGLIVVDYLQLLTSGRRVESRQQEVAEFSRQLKLLAKELEVPLIAISQLNRGVEARGEGARPRLSDLRESGSLEQDADIVMLIDRPDASNRDHERAGEADVILAKHRGGTVGTVTLAHQLHYSKFVDFSGTPATAPAWGYGA